MIGKVVAFENVGRAPLLYVQGSYAGALPFTATSSTDNGLTSSEKLDRLHESTFYLMNKVLQKLQENYLPKQTSTGLNTSEARLLLVLSDVKDITIDELKNLVTIPEEDIHSGVERLIKVGFLDAQYHLTKSGNDMADRLWGIANKQQEDIFGEFKQEDYKKFKQFLQSLLKTMS